MSTRISKTISWLLRHGATKENIQIDNNGWVKITDVLNWLQTRNISASIEDLQRIVDSDDKTRFSITDTHIRCNQGHSMDCVQMDLADFTTANPILHGSYSSSYEPISAQGLKIMSRNHVHLIEVDSYHSQNWKMLRPDVSMYVFVDIARASSDGMKFYKSSNNVVLSDGFNGVIPAEYLTCVKTYKSGVYGFIVLNPERTHTIIVETPAGQLGFPKGKKKRGEHGMACAYRELYEETGLTPNDITVEEYTEPLYDNKMVLYVATCGSNKELSCIDPEELATVGWQEIDEVLELPDNKMRESRKELLRRVRN